MIPRLTLIGLFIFGVFGTGSASVTPQKCTQLPCHAQLPEQLYDDAHFMLRTCIEKVSEETVLVGNIYCDLTEAS